MAEAPPQDRSLMRPSSDHSGDSWDVFLSYSSHNLVVASRIASDLRSGGLTVWHDVSSLPAGQRLRESINHGIRHSKVFLLLASNHSLASRWVLNELDAAMLTEISERKAFVLPVLLGRLDSSKLPVDLIGKRYIDLRHNFTKRYSAKCAYILQSIRLLANQTAEPHLDCVRLVPDFLNRIISHQYDGTRERDSHVRAKIPGFVLSLIDDAWVLFDATEMKNNNAEELLGVNIWDLQKCRDAFRRQYGAFAAQQLALFLVDYLGLSFSGGFTMDQMRSLIYTARIFLGMFALRDFLVAEQGLDLGVEMMDNALAFRVI